MRFLIGLIILVTVLFASIKSEIEEGVYFYKQKQYERALEIFDRVLINHPDSKRARLEYARVLYAMGRYDEAKKEFLYVLNQDVPPIVKKNIKWFLKKIKKRQKRDFFNGYISLGNISDDNIENKSDNPVYGGFIDSNTEKREDRYLSAEVYLQHTRKLEKSLWQNSIYFYDEYLHDKSEDRISYLGLSSTYKFFLYGVRVSLPLGIGFTNVDNEQYMQSYSLNPTFSKKLARNSKLRFKLITEYNKNIDNNEKSFKVYGIDTQWIKRIYKFTTSLGLVYKQYEKVEGDRIDVSKQRAEIKLSTSYSIFPSNFLSMFYKKSQDTYTQKDPTINDERIDKLDKFNIDFQQSIGKHRFFEIGFTKISNKSNLDIYSYDKNIYSLKVKHTF